MAENLSKRFYVENVTEWENCLKKKVFLDRKLEAKVIENGIILPARLLPSPNPLEEYAGGVCDNDFNFIAGFSRMDPHEEQLGGGYGCVESAYPVEVNEIVHIDEDVIFGGTLFGHFGHFMIEHWSRLWYVIQNPELELKVVFVVTHGGYKKWFDDFFRLMGIAKERIIYVVDKPIDKPIQFRSVIVPEQSQYNSWRYIKYTKEFLIPYQAIKSNVKPSNVKKIYLTRSQFKNPLRSFFNEKYFEDFFCNRGFKVIAPEKLNLEEQLSLITGADEIASTEGTLSHWAMFCKPGVKFTMLTRNITAEPIQIFINDAFGIDNYYIVEAYKNFLYVHKHNEGVFFLGSNKHWKEFVADYFGEQIAEYDDNSYLSVALDKYVNAWCKKYSDPKNFDIWVSSLKSLCNRIVTLESKAVKNRPLITYQTHVDKFGWGDWINENQFSNPLDQKHDIQAIKIDFSEPFHNVYYSVYYNEEEGWSEEVTNSQMAGTTGKSKAIFGIKIRLDEQGAEKFDIFYRAHKFNGEWTAWAKNGAELLSDGQKLNAIQIGLRNKN